MQTLTLFKKVILCISVFIGFSFTPNTAKAELNFEEFEILVPANYSNSNSQKLKICGFVVKRTQLNNWAIYFSGGPGQQFLYKPNEKTLLGFENFNVVMFQQRGTYCGSEHQKNYEYYSSENIANDAEEVRKYLNIDNWSVYGMSYGTVPATIYASKFSKSTNALVLRGTLSDGAADFNRPIFAQLVSTFLSRLSYTVQQIILKNLSANPLYLSAVIGEMMERFDSTVDLNEIPVTVKKKPFYEKVDWMNPDKVSSFEEANEEFGMYLYSVINCLELPGMNYIINTNDLKRVKIFSLRTGNFNRFCNEIGKVSVASKEAATIYHAYNYRVSVPITYIHGGLDARTPIDYLVNHYNNESVSTAQRQAIILPAEGHHFIFESNLDIDHPISESYKKILDLALKGEKIRKFLSKSEKKKMGVSSIEDPNYYFSVPWLIFEKDKFEMEDITSLTKETSQSLLKFPWAQSGNANFLWRIRTMLSR